MNQLDLFTEPSYPNAPAIGKTDTSAEAAERVSKIANLLCDLALNKIYENPSTGSEIVESLRERHPQIDVLSIRPRLTELKERGRIRDTGERRKNPKGKNEIVWEYSR
jgi:hypothetical protein